MAFNSLRRVDSNGTFIGGSHHHQRFRRARRLLGPLIEANRAGECGTRVIVCGRATSRGRLAKSAREPASGSFNRLTQRARPLTERRRPSRVPVTPRGTRRAFPGLAERANRVTKSSRDFHFARPFSTRGSDLSDYAPVVRPSTDATRRGPAPLFTCDVLGFASLLAPLAGPGDRFSRCRSNSSAPHFARPTFNF